VQLELELMRGENCTDFRFDGFERTNRLFRFQSSSSGREGFLPVRPRNPLRDSVTCVVETLLTSSPCTQQKRLFFETFENLNWRNRWRNRRSSRFNRTLRHPLPSPPPTPQPSTSSTPLFARCKRLETNFDGRRGRWEWINESWNVQFGKR